MPQIYQITPSAGGKFELRGPAEASERTEFDSLRNAAEHARTCAAGGGEAILRIFTAGHFLSSERPIPGTSGNGLGCGSGTVRPRTYF